ncbi:MAG TPA: serine/threonine-protein kinase [Gaiellaceae bacterium]|jgi:serine/threonine-protein kinase|nr:serine/threonine-protein kinase [Gaiellaceae bacterium]
MADELIAGRYRLIEPLGRGAMSAVWLAQDEELGRQVAVKTLAPSADRQRFEREARAAASLSHPNICSLYDYGEADGKPFMVLEYLQNGSLEDRLRAGKPLPDAETTRIATQVAAGLAHAHERGLVHRDLKPANILFDSEDRAKIADFGIARMGGTGTLTEAGTVLGTASYISPEQAAGQPAGPASDVYSFGVILFRMLTGRLPFVSTNAMELVRMHRDDPPPSVHDFRRDAPARLEAIVAASLAKDPADRPADGRALYAELRDDETAATMLAAPAAAAGTEATRIMPRAAARPAARRSPIVPIAAVAAVVLLLGGVALALALTHGGGSNGDGTVPGLSLPKVPSAANSTTTAPPTTTSASTTAAATTAPTTTAAPTTTHPLTTPPTTTVTPPTTTVAPPTTTVAPPPTTTAPPTTTEPPPTTTTADTTTTTPTTT